eukprot:1196215-Prorocentrum_minimum.AAC.9
MFSFRDENSECQLRRLGPSMWCGGRRPPGRRSIGRWAPIRGYGPHPEHGGPELVAPLVVKVGHVAGRLAVHYTWELHHQPARLRGPPESQQVANKGGQRGQEGSAGGQVGHICQRVAIPEVTRSKVTKSAVQGYRIDNTSIHSITLHRFGAGWRALPLRTKFASSSACSNASACTPMILYVLMVKRSGARYIPGMPTWHAKRHIITQSAPTQRPLSASARGGISNMCAMAVTNPSQIVTEFWVWVQGSVARGAGQRDQHALSAAPGHSDGELEVVREANWKVVPVRTE